MASIGFSATVKKNKKQTTTHPHSHAVFSYDKCEMYVYFIKKVYI